jgi:hypothetical protein
MMQNYPGTYWMLHFTVYLNICQKQIKAVHSSEVWKWKVRASIQRQIYLSIPKVLYIAQENIPLSINDKTFLFKLTNVDTYT